MCGIAGFTQFNRQFGGEQELKAMGDQIAHRGPDASGAFIDKHIGLCHRRLSIIDLSEQGNQPMFSQDKNIVLVFNGEIYNFQELKKEISEDQYSFNTKTDTEVIIALYDMYGEAFVTKIEGMFAIALWDVKKEKLILARDHLGKKPLYYWKQDNDIVFASEIKSILSLKEFPKTIRLDALHDFFAYQYIPDPKTIFEGLNKLEPGHYLTVQKDEFRIKQYWDLSFASPRILNDDETSKALADLIDQSTAERMVSDVPLGAFLSGGVDSSLVVAMMAKNQSEPITTCSIGFDDERFNELEFSQAVAQQYQTEHHELIIRQNMLDNLEDIVSYFDEPFADPSLVPTFHVSKLARQQVTVALAGDGGDEMFAGYEKYAMDYKENRLKSKIPRWLRKTLCAPLGRRLSLSDNDTCKRIGSLCNTLSCDAAYGFYISNSQISDPMWDFLVKDEIKKNLAGYHPSEVTIRHYESSDAPDHLGKILYTDIKTYLPGDILVKVDRMSMANSLEVRAPLLDYKVAEFSAKIQSDSKLRKGEKKYILKKAFSDYLSNDILYRKKMGFSVPLAVWMREELRERFESLIFESNSGVLDFFNRAPLQHIWQQHLDQKIDHSSVLWSMLMFQMWWNKYML